MSYAGLGNDAPITSGVLAKTDPFMSKASLMASNVMKRMALVSKPARAAWLRQQLNGLWPHMGDEVMVNIAQLSENKGRNQAIFDAIRLALANRLMEWAGQQAARGGLGDFASDARTFACTSASMGATVGGFVGAFRAGSDTSIIGGAQAGAGIANCNLETLRLQAEIAAQQANAAASGASAASNRTIIVAGIGIAGILGLAITAKILLK